MSLPKWLEEKRSGPMVRSEDLLMELPDISPEEYDRASERYLVEARSLIAVSQPLLYLCLLIEQIIALKEVAE